MQTEFPFSDSMSDSMMDTQTGKVMAATGIALASGESSSQAGAKSRTMPLASIGLRCGAFLLDYILVLMVPAIFISIALLFKRVNSPIATLILLAGYALMTLLIVLNWIYLVRNDGQTLGKRILGIRIVQRNGRPPDYSQVLLRHAMGYPLLLLSCGIGWIWALWDRKQQGWHDKLAGTVVVRVH